MNVLAAIVLCALAADPAVEANAPVGVSIWAIQATNTPVTDAPQKTPQKDGAKEEQHFDNASKPLEKVLKDLPYRYFKTLKTTRKTVQLGEEEQVEITKGKTLRLSPLEKTKEGRTRMEITLEMKPKDPKKSPVKALETRLLMSPGKAVKLRGLKLEEGELILVLVSGG